MISCSYLWSYNDLPCLLRRVFNDNLDGENVLIAVEWMGKGWRPDNISKFRQGFALKKSTIHITQNNFPNFPKSPRPLCLSRPRYGPFKVFNKTSSQINRGTSLISKRIRWPPQGQRQCVSLAKGRAKATSQSSEDHLGQLIPWM